MVTVVGEDPASVVLRWDGPEGGTMFQWDAWYAKLSRLTFDGGGRAETCLRYGPHFSTYNETSDLVLRDASRGIVFGGPDSAGQAENEVLRCRFLRCGVGSRPSTGTRWTSGSGTAASRTAAAASTT